MLAEFTLKDCLFGVVKLTENANPNKCSYSGYEIGFDSHTPFLIPNFDWGKNVVNCGVDMSSFVHANKKNKGLDNTSLTAETKYSINFSRSERKFCLSLHYNGSNSFLLIVATKIHHFKAKDSEIKRHRLYLRNI